MRKRNSAPPNTPKKFSGTLWGYPPEIDLEKEAGLQKAIIELIQDGLVESAHDCTDGGIAVALAEKTFPKRHGSSGESGVRRPSRRICLCLARTPAAS